MLHLNTQLQCQACGCQLNEATASESPVRCKTEAEARCNLGAWGPVDLQGFQRLRYGKAEDQGYMKLCRPGTLFGDPGTMAKLLGIPRAPDLVLGFDVDVGKPLGAMDLGMLRFNTELRLSARTALSIPRGSLVQAEPGITGRMQIRKIAKKSLKC